MDSTGKPTFTIDSNVSKVALTVVTKNTVSAGPMDTRVRFATVAVKF